MSWSDQELPLAERLSDWVDWDGSAYALGQTLGVVGDVEFLDVKHIFWTNNPLGRELHGILHALVRAGVLESNEDDEKFRWKPSSPSAESDEPTAFRSEFQPGRTTRLVRELAKLTDEIERRSRAMTHSTPLDEHEELNTLFHRRADMIREMYEWECPQ